MLHLRYPRYAPVCAFETESTNHLFLRCQNYVSFRTALMNELYIINSGMISVRPSALLEVLLYGVKCLMITQISKYLLRLSITFKIHNGLNSPYFKYLKVSLFTSCLQMFQFIFSS